MAKARTNRKSGAINAELPECPVCLEVMSAPIFQCQSGHSLCHVCTQSLLPPICPICRQTMTQMRNWQLEDMVNKAKVPCPFKELGCVFTMASIDKEDHLKECIFRDMQCPYGTTFGSCSWSGKLKEIMLHFKNNHPQNCNIDLDTDVDVNGCTTVNNERFMFLLSQGKFLFILTIKIDTLQKMVYFVVQHLGSKKAAQQYVYEVHVTSKKDDRRQIMFTDQCFNDVYDINKIFNDASCGAMPLTMFSHFIKDKTISLKVIIRRSQPFNKNKMNNNSENNNSNNDKNQSNKKPPSNFRAKSPGPHFKPKGPKSVGLKKKN